MRAVRFLFRLLLIGLVGAIGWVYWQITQVAGGADPQTLLSVATAPQGFFPQSRINILVVGKDYNHTNQGIAYSKNSRSDTIMMLSLDMEHRTAAAVSVPRDTYVTATDGIGGKINGTFARGGVGLLKQTLEQTFDVKIDHYLVFKDTAVKNMVDAVGGVWVETIDEMNYDDSWGNLHIHLPQGRQFINGEQAVGFVRFREVNTYKLDKYGRQIPIYPVKHSKEEGDLRRTVRQQQLISAIAQQAVLPQNLLRLRQVADVAFGEIETDLSRVEMMALGASVGRQGLGGLKGQTLPGEGGYYGGAYYYNLERPKAWTMVDWLIKGDLTAGNRMVAVSIYNASQVPGVAKATASLLEKQAFSLGNIATANSPASESRLVYKQAALESQARAIAALLNIPKVEKNPDYPENADVTVFIGSDLGQALLERSQSQ